MELPFIVKKMLTDLVAGLNSELERGNVYDSEHIQLMRDIRHEALIHLNAETMDKEKAEFDAMYPEHAKQDKVKDEAQAIGVFIESGGYVLCNWPDGESHPRPTNESINQVLAKFYDVDLMALEQEKQKMLAKLANPGG